MEAEDWKYVQNQFDAVTRDDNPLMTEIIMDTWPKLLSADGEDPAFDVAKDIVDPPRLAWLAADTALANAEGAHALATDLFENKLAQLTQKPDPDTNSLGVQWESVVTSNVASDGPTYHYLLPTGRSGWSGGTYTERLAYVQQFGTRLGEQTGKAALLALSTTVLAFSTALGGLRETQTAKEGELTTARAAMEPLRVDLCQGLHGMIGFALFKWYQNPVRIASLVELELLRESQQELPAAPTDTTWTPAGRTLATTVMPANATRLELWRQGPGGAPERLLVGDTGALALAVPAAYTFTTGQVYQLWLQGRNSRGTSTPRPKTNLDRDVRRG